MLLQREQLSEIRDQLAGCRVRLFRCRRYVIAASDSAIMDRQSRQRPAAIKYRGGDRRRQSCRIGRPIDSDLGRILIRRLATQVVRIFPQARISTVREMRLPAIFASSRAATFFVRENGDIRFSISRFSSIVNTPRGCGLSRFPGRATVFGGGVNDLTRRFTPKSFPKCARARRGGRYNDIVPVRVRATPRRTDFHPAFVAVIFTAFDIPGALAFARSDRFTGTLGAVC